MSYDNHPLPDVKALLLVNNKFWEDDIEDLRRLRLRAEDGCSDQYVYAWRDHEGSLVVVKQSAVIGKKFAPEALIDANRAGGPTIVVPVTEEAPVADSLEEGFRLGWWAGRKDYQERRVEENRVEVAAMKARRDRNQEALEAAVAELKANSK